MQYCFDFSCIQARFTSKCRKVNCQFLATNRRKLFSSQLNSNLMGWTWRIPPWKTKLNKQGHFCRRLRSCRWFTWCNLCPKHSNGLIETSQADDTKARWLRNEGNPEERLSLEQTNSTVPHKSSGHEISKEKYANIGTGSSTSCYGDLIHSLHDISPSNTWQIKFSTNKKKSFKMTSLLSPVLKSSQYDNLSNESVQN